MFRNRTHFALISRPPFLKGDPIAFVIEFSTDYSLRKIDRQSKVKITHVFLPVYIFFRSAMDVVRRGNNKCSAFPYSRSRKRSRTYRNKCAFHGSNQYRLGIVPWWICLCQYLTGYLAVSGRRPDDNAFTDLRIFRPNIRVLRQRLTLRPLLPRCFIPEEAEKEPWSLPT